MPLDASQIHEVPDDVLAAIDYCFEQGWTDGLPVVPLNKAPRVVRIRFVMNHFSSLSKTTFVLDHFFITWQRERIGGWCF